MTLTRLLFICPALALCLVGCGANTTVVVESEQESRYQRLMDNCDRSVAMQRKTANLSPRCICQWDERTNDAFVLCSTCDPFQVGGIECGDASQLP